MGFYTTETYPEVADLPLKNRVGGSRRSSPLRAGRFTPQPFETVSETAVTFTITVSGLSFWLSRDPIEELGGANLYGFVDNNPVIWFDPFGLTACSWKVGRCTRNVGGATVPSTVTIRGRTFTIPETIRNAVNRVIPDHHDVKVESYASTDGSGTAEATVVRGFFADDFNGSLGQYAVSLIPFSRVDGYVPGSVQDSAATAGACSLSLVSQERFDQVKQRITTSAANRYHLTRYNCQTWAAEQLVP